jgi:hypothetical protein
MRTERSGHWRPPGSDPELMSADWIPVPDIEPVDRWSPHHGICPSMPHCRGQEPANEKLPLRLGRACPCRRNAGTRGHKSKAIHRAYASQAKVVTLPLEHYEMLQANKIIEFQKGLSPETELGKVAVG